jgi:hypothetical protein
MAIGFVIGMFVMFVVFSIFFVSMMSSYKDNRLKNIPVGYYEKGLKDLSGTQMIFRWDGLLYFLILPFSTYCLYYFLKNKIFITNKLN